MKKRATKPTAPKARRDSPERKPSMPVIRSLPACLTAPLTAEDEFATWLRRRKIQALANMAADTFERFHGKGLNALMADELANLRAAFGFTNADALTIARAIAAEIDRRRRIREAGLYMLAEALVQAPLEVQP
jgi:hypothetical protein